MRDLSLWLMPYPDKVWSDDGKSFEIKRVSKDENNKPHAATFCEPSLRISREVFFNDDELL